MAFVSMANAVPGGIASSSEYNKVVANVNYLNDNLPRGRIGSTMSGTSNLTTTDSVVDSLTLTLVSGRRYRVTACYVYGTTATNYFFNLRYKAGTTVDTSGTSFFKIAPNGTASQNTPVTLVGEFVAPSSGSFVIAVTCRTGTSTGTIPNDGTNHQKFFCVDDIGL